MNSTSKRDPNLLMQFSPNVRRAWNHRVSKMLLKPRIIFDYELLYVEKGELSIRIDKDFHTMVTGDIVLFKPGKEHEILGSTGECWMPHIHFDLLYYEDFEDVPINFKTLKECSEGELRLIRPDILGTALRLPDVIRISNHAEIYNTIMRLIHAYDRRDPGFAILQKSLLLHIIYHLEKGLDAKMHTHLTLHQKALEQVVTHIVEHYNETIPLDDLSRIACLSVYHFSRLFKEKYSLSPHQFQIRHRIEKAKELMSYSRLSLTSIAEKIGYGSLYAFSKAFKQAEGVSPRQFVRTFLGD